VLKGKSPLFDKEFRALALPDGTEERKVYLQQPPEVHDIASLYPVIPAGGTEPVLEQVSFSLFRRPIVMYNRRAAVPSRT